MTTMVTPVLPEPPLLITQDDAVLTVMINRPHARNAMTLAMYQDLLDLCARLHQDSHIRVVIFTGAGDQAFMAGTDISEFANAHSTAQTMEVEALSVAALTAVTELPQVTIAALNGTAAGGGCVLAMGCDLRVAADHASASLPLAKNLGNALPWKTVNALREVLGKAVLSRMLLAAEVLDAAALQSLGLVSWVCPGAGLAVRAADFGHRVAGLAPTTQAVSKYLMAADVEPDDVAEVVEATYDHPDFAAAIDFFVAGDRRPVFSPQRFVLGSPPSQT